MVYSMTGFGRAESKFSEKSVSVEIKSLNSKGLDVRIRSNLPVGEKEMVLRKRIGERLQKGKVDVVLTIHNLADNPNHVINVPLFKQYYRTLKKLADELEMQTQDFVQPIMRIPAVIEPAENVLSEEDWKDILIVFEEAEKKLVDFRKIEGESIFRDLEKGALTIKALLDEIAQHEAPRVERMRQRLKGLLTEFLGSENVDANRFEQEVLFFLDKIDISEEKTRLAKHCEHFLDRLNAPGEKKGRVLAFISQEMGREINTLGAKAYSSEMQVIVVRMKEELEKIKEQILNTL